VLSLLIHTSCCSFLYLPKVAFFPFSISPSITLRIRLLQSYFPFPRQAFPPHYRRSRFISGCRSLLRKTPSSLLTACHFRPTFGEDSLSHLCRKLLGPLPGPYPFLFPLPAVDSPGGGMLLSFFFSLRNHRPFPFFRIQVTAIDFFFLPRVFPLPETTVLKTSPQKSVHLSPPATLSCHVEPPSLPYFHCSESLLLVRSL